METLTPESPVQDVQRNDEFIPPDVAVTAPGKLKVIKRNGKVAPFDKSKIAVAMTKAFLAVEGNTAADSTRVHDMVAKLTDKIMTIFNTRLATGGTLHIEDIQDQVELALMREGEQKVARAYVLYREERRRARDADSTQDADGLRVMLSDGKVVPLDKEWLTTVVNDACQGLENVSAEHIINETQRNLFDGVPLTEVNKAMVMCARPLIEKEPNYSYVAAGLLLNDLRNEALGYLNLGMNVTRAQMSEYYPKALRAFIDRAVALELLSPALQDFDFERLGAAIVPDRDFKSTYLGLQTLYDRYFIHHGDIRFELPQVFFMRVAMGLCINEEDKNGRAIEFYNQLSTFDYMSSTPTLFNSGTLRSQLSSCYLTTIPDNLEGIYSSMRDNALLSKFAGGLGNDWTPVRGIGAHIKGTNGTSQGVVPFLNAFDATTIAVNQGGKRKGATAAYLSSWHIDIEEFLELRKNTGDDRRRTHDMNTATWVPDLLMMRVFENKDWTLFSPDETPDLHDAYGQHFKVLYEEYEAKANRGEIKNFRRLPAVSLWRKMLAMLFETGHPWITFKDPCNLRSPQQHMGVVHSSNLCTEITLNTSQDEIAVCNLGSINLPEHIDENGLNKEKLRKTVYTAVRMLDNVIDINYYAVPQAKNSNFRHRPVGLGIMGFQDALYKLGLSYASDEAVDFADQSMELVSYYAIEASHELSKERGSYESFDGSLWSKGVLPIDSIADLAAARGQYLEQDTSCTLDWSELRKKVKKGMRNSNLLAIAPTATISNICGVSQSIEPTYQNLFVKSNLSGEFTVVNPYLVNDLKALNLWDDVMVNDLKYFNGSIQQISRIPAHIKQRYVTAFEMEPRWLVDAGSRRMKWIDQSQSLNLYMAEPSGKKLDILYRMAWLRGLKTTYYLRSMGATNTEKATIHDGALNAVSVDSAPKACSIDDPDCEACQ